MEEKKLLAYTDDASQRQCIPKSHFTILANNSQHPKYTDKTPGQHSGHGGSLGQDGLCQNCVRIVIYVCLHYHLYIKDWNRAEQIGLQYKVHYSSGQLSAGQ